jgi:hypothetical protein
MTCPIVSKLSDVWMYPFAPLATAAKMRSGYSLLDKTAIDISG